MGHWWNLSSVSMERLSQNTVTDKEQNKIIMGPMGKSKPMGCLRGIRDIAVTRCFWGQMQRKEGMEVSKGGTNLGRQRGQEIMPGIMAGTWGESSGYCLPGLQEAFDTVSHKILLEKLLMLWVGWTEVGWKLAEWPGSEGGDQQRKV